MIWTPVFTDELVPAFDDSVVLAEYPAVTPAVPPVWLGATAPPPTPTLKSNPLLVDAPTPVFVAVDSCRRSTVDGLVPTSSALTGVAFIRTTPARLPCGLTRSGDTTQPLRAGPRLSRMVVGSRKFCRAVRPGAPSRVMDGCSCAEMEANAALVSRSTTASGAGCSSAAPQPLAGTTGAGATAGGVMLERSSGMCSVTSTSAPGAEVTVTGAPTGRFCASVSDTV